jgi:hypothetical protein
MERYLLILRPSIQLSLTLYISEYRMNQTVNCAVWGRETSSSPSISCMKRRQPFRFRSPYLLKPQQQTTATIEQENMKKNGEKICTLVPQKKSFAHKSDTCTYSCLYWHCGWWCNFTKSFCGLY